MRIVGGRLRGRRLASLGRGDESARLRPTTDRLRESLFAILEGGRFGAPVPGATVLDLFAGTGALGLEAISRGARRAVFVESGRKGAALVSANVAALGLEGCCRLLRCDARALPPPGDAGEDAGATLVFLDPPYGRGLGAPALSRAASGGWLAPGALVVWEEQAPQPAPSGFRLIEARRYGDTAFTFLRHEPVASGPGAAGGAEPTCPTPACREN